MKAKKVIKYLEKSYERAKPVAQKVGRGIAFGWGVVQEGSRRANINIATAQAEIENSKPKADLGLAQAGTNYSSNRLLGLNKPALPTASIGRMNVPKSSVGRINVSSQPLVRAPSDMTGINRPVMNMPSRTERKAIRRGATRFNPLGGLI